MTTILLTSCIHPVGIKYSGTIEIRKQQYIQAVNFYISNTNYNIVFCDSSNCNIEKCFDSNNRLEFLYFNDESYNKERGKGAGEANIIEYALHNSLFLKSSNIIIKITGRHIIKNINTLMRNIHENVVYIDVDLKFSYAMSYFFVVPNNFMLDYFLPNKNLIDDSINNHFEKILAFSLKNWIYSNRLFLPFFHRINIFGTMGGSGILYSDPSIYYKFRTLTKYIFIRLYVFYLQNFNLHH